MTEHESRWLPPDPGTTSCGSRGWEVEFEDDETREILSDPEAMRRLLLAVSGPVYPDWLARLIPGWLARRRRKGGGT